MTLRDLEKRLEKDPDNLALRVTVAGMYREAGRIGEAVELYRSVALAYRDQGRAQQAIAVCKSVLELAPDDHAIHALLAELVKHHHGRAARDTAEQYGTDIETPVTPPPGNEAVTSPGEQTPRPRSPSGQEVTGTSSRPPPIARAPSASESRPPSGTAHVVPRLKPPTDAPAVPATTSRPPVGTRPPTARPPTAPAGPARVGQRPLVPSPAGTVGSRPPASAATRAASLTPPAGTQRPSIPGVNAPARRSSLEETPLPKPVPYHVADPTSSAQKIVKQDLDELPSSEGATTRPGSEPNERTDMTGLAQAARRISGLISQDLPPARGSDVDVAAELETRQIPRVSAAELDKISGPPPTAPVGLVDDDDLIEHLPTPVPDRPPPRRPSTSPAIPIRDTPRDPPTDLHALALSQRDGDDELTAPRELVTADPLANAFFVPLPANRREAALARCVKRSARAGSTVIRQGETSHPLILVISGRLELRVERPNGTLAMLDTIDPGQYIGEAALLGRMPASANVIAAVDCELLALPPHALFELAGAFPALWAALKDSAERRTRQYDKLIRAST